MKKFLAATVAVAGLAFASVPAHAVVTTFAAYSQTGAAPAADIRWVKSASGTGGEICATTTASCANPGSVAVQFDFLQPILSSLGNLSAAFTFDGVAPSGNPAQTLGSFLVQPGIAGTFKFTYTGAAPLHVGTTTYLTGANLLTGTIYSDASIFGAKNSTSGSVTASTGSGSTIVYTSDFLNFTGTVNRDFSINLTSESPKFTALAGKAVGSFKANSGGAFSSDPAPIVTGVPEPTTWALMLIGFGGMGAVLRRRRSDLAVAA